MYSAVHRIIGPIASRCAKFRFQPLAQEVMGARLKHIASSEGFEISDQVNTPFPSVMVVQVVEEHKHVTGL